MKIKPNIHQIEVKMKHILKKGIGLLMVLSFLAVSVNAWSFPTWKPVVIEKPVIPEPPQWKPVVIEKPPVLP